MTDTQARIEAGMTVLRGRFMERLPARLDELAAAFAAFPEAGGEEASAHMARLAHSLAGAAGTFGFEALAAAARRLDACLRDPANPRARVAAGLAEVSRATAAIARDGTFD